jgi:CubicO group peptidase (beta-lactamase class C family)
MGCLVFFLATWTASAQACPPDVPCEAIDAKMNELMGELNIPGMALGIVRGDQAVYLMGYGKADNSGREVTPQTPFLLASISKSFTGLAIMQLVEEGKIDLNERVVHYLPWFRTADESASNEMTVSQLLYQTSGLTTFTGTVFPEYPVATALEDTVRSLSSAGLHDVPGGSFEYSNSNFDVLGLLVQTVSGQRYENYVQEHIFEPLEMQHSHTVMALDAARADGMAEGFTQFFGISMPYNAYLFPYGNVASAGVIASAEDLTHAIIAHLNDGQYGETRVISPDGMETLHRSGADLGGGWGYAMGWFRGWLWDAGQPDDLTLNVPAVIQHDGSASTFRAFVVLVPGEDLGVVTLINTNDFARESAFGSTAHNAALLMLGIEPVGIFLSEDAISQNGRYIGLALVALLTYRLIRAVRILRRWRRQPEARPHGALAIIWQVIVPLLVDVILAWLVSVYLPAEVARAPLITIIRTSPDLGLMYILVLVLLAWGIVRTVLYVLALRRPTPMMVAAS